MDELKKIELEAKNNYSNYCVEKEDPWHQKVEKVLRSTVLKLLSKNDNEKAIIINAGSGGENYPTKGKLIHLDIVDNNIKKFKNFIVASITNIPLENNLVDIIICVGSVVNYTDAEKAIKEFSRILKPKGKLIIEFERSDSADFLFSGNHHKEKLNVVYDYNNQKHPMIMYGEKYIKKILRENNFEVIRRKRFHIASILASKIGCSEKFDYKFIHLDFLLKPFSYELAHNCIFICEKKY